MAMLLGCRWACEGYVRRAESEAACGLEWFQKGQKDDEETVVLGTKYGDDLIGTAVLRFPAKNALPTSAFYDDLKKVEITAWTVGLRFRGKGIGRALLEEAVRLAIEREGSDVKVVFAKEHANKVIGGYEMFNGVFRSGERKADKLLRDVAAEARSDDVGDLI